MEALRQNQRARKQEAARMLAIGSSQPRIFALHRPGDPQLTQILARPERPLAAIQNVDPTDPNVGQFVFMAGYDPIDGGAAWR